MRSRMILILIVLLNVSLFHCAKKEQVKTDTENNAQVSSDSSAEETTDAITSEGILNDAVIDNYVNTQGYGVNYNGPVLYDESTLKAPGEEPIGDSVSVPAYVEYHFAKICKERIAKLNRQLQGIDKNKYKEILQKRKTDALALSGKSVAGSKVIQQFMQEKDSRKRDSLIQCITKEKLLEESALSLTPQIDSSGVLTGGVAYYLEGDSIKKLLPIILADGFVLTLAPQILYGWPGVEASALGVIHPKDGPFEVTLAFTEHTTKHLQVPVFAKYDAIAKDEYLNYKSRSYVAVTYDGLTGWLSVDSCSYWGVNNSGNMNNSKKLFLNGYAQVLQGIYEGDPSRGTGKDGCDTCVVSLGRRWIIDFKRMAEISIEGQRVHEYDNFNVDSAETFGLTDFVAFVGDRPFYDEDVSVISFIDATYEIKNEPNYTYHFELTYSHNATAHNTIETGFNPFSIKNGTKYLGFIKFLQDSTSGLRW